MLHLTTSSQCKSQSKSLFWALTLGYEQAGCANTVAAGNDPAVEEQKIGIHYTTTFQLHYTVRWLDGAGIAAEKLAYSLCTCGCYSKPPQLLVKATQPCNVCTSPSAARCSHSAASAHAEADSDCSVPSTLIPETTPTIFAVKKNRLQVLFTPQGHLGIPRKESIGFKPKTPNCLKTVTKRKQAATTLKSVLSIPLSINLQVTRMTPLS